MRIVNEQLLASQRGPGRCEWCGQHVAAREAHHVFKRGSGRLDVPWNLLWVGRTQPFPLCPCHGDLEAGRIMQEDALLKIAGRDGWLQPVMVRVVNALRWLPKSPRPKDIAEAKRRFSLGHAETELLCETLAEAGVELEDAA